MSETRTELRRGRKPLAVILSIAVAAVGLSLAPVAVSSASASTATSLRTYLMKDLNAWRASQHVKAIKLNSRMDTFLQLEANIEGYELTGTRPPASFFASLSELPSGGTNEFDSGGFADAGSVSAQALEMAQSIEASDGSTTDFLTDNYAGVGFTNFEGQWEAYFTSEYFAKVLPVSAKPHVSITGKTVVGSTLTAHTSIKATATTDVQYMWLAGGIPTGTTTSTFTPCGCDLGLSIGVLVVTTQNNKDASVALATTSTHVTLPNLTTAPVTVSGDRYVGHTLTASTGTWAPDDVDLSYQWLRDSYAIPGATDDTYTQVAEDVGHKITVRVYGESESGDYLEASRVSTTSVKTGGPTLTNTTAPSISGTDTVGQTLTADPGVWIEGSPTFTYQWKVGGVAVSGATKPTFVVPASAYSAAGKTVTVTVTAHETGYSATPATSDATDTIAGLAFTPTGTVGYSGTAAVGSTLTATLPAYSPKPTTITYSWSLGGTVVSTKSTYKVAPAASGQTLTLVVTASKSGYVSDVETDAAISVP